MIQPMYTVHYSDDEHDYLSLTTDSLFEATCDYYYMLDDLEDNEWVSIYDSNDKIVVTS